MKTNVKFGRYEMLPKEKKGKTPCSFRILPGFYLFSDSRKWKDILMALFP
jgi:hypothetical protein